MIAPASRKRILIGGGGFGGVYTAHRLERLFRRRSDVEIVLVSRDRDRSFSGAQRGDDRRNMVPNRAVSRQTAGFPHATGGGV
jgi:hypothetical protein